MGNSDFPAALIGLFVLIGIGVIILALVISAKRRAALAQFAKDYGFLFFPETFRVDGWLGSDSLPGRFDWYGGLEGFSPFGQGHSRKIINPIMGQRNGFEWVFFDYSYTTGSGKSQATHSYGVALAFVPYNFPQISIGPENFFTRLGNSIGFSDIQFESEQFNREYRVTCGDRKQAYDIVHPQMIEFLLATERRSWQVAGAQLVFTEAGSYAPPEMLRIIEDVKRFVDLLPPYFKEEIKQ